MKSRTATRRSTRRRFGGYTDAQLKDRLEIADNYATDMHVAEAAYLREVAERGRRFTPEQREMLANVVRQEFAKGRADQAALNNRIREARGDILQTYKQYKEAHAGRRATRRNRRSRYGRKL